MQTDAFFGHYCASCRTAVAVTAVAGGTGRCPTCGGPLVAGTGGPRMKSVANYKCPKCGAQYGMISIAGAPTCRCGEPMQA